MFRHHLQNVHDTLEGEEMKVRQIIFLARTLWRLHQNFPYPHPNPTLHLLPPRRKGRPEAFRDIADLRE